MMNRRNGFTLIELLVVIAIIALLMAILMPALQRVKKQGKMVACLSLLKQWSLWFSMYAEEYDGYFMEGFDGTSKGTGNNRWCRAMGSYHKYNSDFSCCPNATQPWFDEAGNATGLEGTYRGSTSAWGYWQQDGWLAPLKGSYGINGFCNNPEPEVRNVSNNWKGPNVKGAGYVPLFLGGQRYNFWPNSTDTPPAFDGEQWQGDNMGRICLNRHNGFVSCLFLDFSARKVGLKELWTLKWSRNYNTGGPWTQAGGAISSDWPEWMKSFKDY